MSKRQMPFSCLVFSYVIALSRAIGLISQGTLHEIC
jgi:hypothetical protein